MMDFRKLSNIALYKFKNYFHCLWFQFQEYYRMNNIWRKVIMQGKLIQRCTHLFYCSLLSLSGNGNTRMMSKPGMGSIFHIKNQWNILFIGNYYVNYQDYQNLMLFTSSDTKQTLMHLSLFTNSPRENLFQYVRRVYATTINFPCIITLVWRKSMSYNNPILEIPYWMNKPRNGSNIFPE